MLHPSDSFRVEAFRVLEISVLVLGSFFLFAFKPAIVKYVNAPKEPMILNPASKVAMPGVVLLA